MYFDIDAYFSVFGPFVNYFTAISIWSLLMGGVLAVYFMFLVSRVCNRPTRVHMHVLVYLSSGMTTLSYYAPLHVFVMCV